MGVKERIYQFIEYINTPVSKFEETCGLSNGYISSMRKGFGTKKLDNVLNEFPALSRDWILYGEGEMLKSMPPNNDTNLLTEDTMTIAMLTKMLYDSQARVKELEQEVASLEGENSALKYGAEKKESKIG